MRPISGADDASMARPVVVLGLPRSGTTWSARLVASAGHCRPVMEPDNEKTSPPAITAKRAVGRFPVLAPGQSEPAYRRLWDWALSGAPGSLALRGAGALLRGASEDELEGLMSGHRSLRVAASDALARGLPDSEMDDRRPVVKSVHACLAAEWLAHEFAVEVVVVRRNPAGVLASWLELDLPDSDRALDRDPVVRTRYLEPWGIEDPGRGRVARAAWHLGLLSSALEDALARHPEWHVVEHEALCLDPHARLHALFSELDLTWTERVEELLADDDRPGTGFSTHRRRLEVPGSWQTRLAETELAALHRELDGFPHQQWWRTADPAPDPRARR